MATPDESLTFQGQLSAMVVAVQSNRGAIERLEAQCGVFRFTGGALPTEEWQLAAMHAFLSSPFVDDSVPRGDVQRYQKSLDTIIALSHTMPLSTRPKTLRQRFELTAEFRRASADVLAPGNRLESALTCLIGNVCA